MIEAAKFVLDRVENIVEKGENAVISIFSFSHNVFQKADLKPGDSRKTIERNLIKKKISIGSSSSVPSLPHDFIKSRHSLYVEIDIPYTVKDNKDKISRSEIRQEFLYSEIAIYTVQICNVDWRQNG